MPTYFLKISGNDGLDGLSEANAWATPTKAFTTTVAGDTTHIAPGTYRNAAGWAITNAGNFGNPIIFEGDPDCEHFANENKGPVRLTGCNATETPARNGTVLDARKDYITLRNLNLDGIVNDVAGYGIWFGAGTSRRAEKCIIIGGTTHALSGGIAVACVAIGDRGFSGATCTRCIGFGSYYAFENCNATNCIGLGGQSFRGGVGMNCLGFAGFGPGDYTNCIAMGGATNFGNSTTANCLAIGGHWGFNLCVRTACSALYSKVANIGGSGDPVTQAKHVGWTSLLTLLDIARSLKCDLMFEKDMGTAAGAPVTDILSQLRPLHDGVNPSPGAHEYSDVGLDWVNYHENPPGVPITRKGMEEFQAYGIEGSEVIVICWVKFDVAGGADKPQLILSGDGIATQTDTATGDGVAFEELSVAATPTKDCELTIRLYQRDETAAKYAIFSDIEVR